MRLNLLWEPELLFPSRFLSSKGFTQEVTGEKSKPSRFNHLFGRLKEMSPGALIAPSGQTLPLAEVHSQTESEAEDGNGGQVARSLPPWSQQGFDLKGDSGATCTEPRAWQSCCFELYNRDILKMRQFQILKSQKIIVGSTWECNAFFFLNIREYMFNTLISKGLIYCSLKSMRLDPSAPTSFKLSPD